MRLYRLGKLGSLDALQLTEEAAPKPGAHEVLVRMRACSLNHRDLNIMSGTYTSVALIYLAIAWPLTQLVYAVERTLRRQE